MLFACGVQPGVAGNWRREANQQNYVSWFGWWNLFTSLWCTWPVMFRARGSDDRTCLCMLNLVSCSFPFTLFCQKHVLSWRCSNLWDDSQMCLHTCPCWCSVSWNKRETILCHLCWMFKVHLFLNQVRFGFKWVRVVWGGFVCPTQSLLKISHP